MAGRLAVVFALVVLSGFCMGQASGRLDLFGGFSYVSQDYTLTNPNSTGPIGWNASATFPVGRMLGVVADVSGYYPSYNFGCGPICGQSARAHSFLFGPEVSVTRGRLRPFARFLIGDTNLYTYGAGASATTFTSHNSFTFGAGGGVDIGLTRRLAIRGQVDWLHNGFQTSDNQRTNEEHHNLARISTGIVIRF